MLFQQDELPDDAKK